MSLPSVVIGKWDESKRLADDDLSTVLYEIALSGGLDGADPEKISCVLANLAVMQGENLIPGLVMFCRERPDIALALRVLVKSGHLTWRIGPTNVES